MFLYDVSDKYSPNENDNTSIKDDKSTNPFIVSKNLYSTKKFLYDTVEMVSKFTELKIKEPRPSAKEMLMIRRPFTSIISTPKSDILNTSKKKSKKQEQNQNQ